MDKIKNLLHINLQLFGEDGGTGAEGTTSSNEGVAPPTTKGRKSNPLANVKYGIQEDNVEIAEPQKTEKPAEATKVDFDSLIKGDYKADFDAKVQDILSKRFKSTNEKVANYDALSPVLNMLATKYGVDAKNTEALVKAIEEDESYYENEALERGVSVEHLKEIKKMERENASLREQMKEQENRKRFEAEMANWISQGEEAKKFYPSLDLNAEFNNEEFRKLLNAGVDVRSAYEVIHRNEIMPMMMQHAVKETEAKITNKILANAQRPSENGMNSQAASITKSDVSQLTKQDRLEIMRRIANGEKISFGKPR